MKSISTEEFSRLNNVVLYCITINIVGLRQPLCFKSLDRGKLLDRLRCAEVLFGSCVDFEILSFSCKDTVVLYDEGSVYCGIGSFKGEFLK